MDLQGLVPSVSLSSSHHIRKRLQRVPMRDAVFHSLFCVLRQRTELAASHHAAEMNVRHLFARIFGNCLKGRRHDEVYTDWEHCVGKEGTSKMALTPVPSIGISPVHLQPCATAAGVNNDPDQASAALWTDANQLVNAAAAWQIRRVMPIEVAALDESALAKMSTPALAQRFRAFPVLMVLRADNKGMRELSPELLSTEAFAGLTLLERRAIHNVLAERPGGWSDAQLSLYAARERELIEMANENFSGWGQNDTVYSVHPPFAYSAYAREPRGW